LYKMPPLYEGELTRNLENLNRVKELVTFIFDFPTTSHDNLDNAISSIQKLEHFMEQKQVILQKWFPREYSECKQKLEVIKKEIHPRLWSYSETLLKQSQTINEDTQIEIAMELQCQLKKYFLSEYFVWPEEIRTRYVASIEYVQSLIVKRYEAKIEEITRKIPFTTDNFDILLEEVREVTRDNYVVETNSLSLQVRQLEKEIKFLQCVQLRKSAETLENEIMNYNLISAASTLETAELKLQSLSGMRLSLNIPDCLQKEIEVAFENTEQTIRQKKEIFRKEGDECLVKMIENINRLDEEGQLEDHNSPKIKKILNELKIIEQQLWEFRLGREDWYEIALGLLSSTRRKLTENKVPLEDMLDDF